MKPTEYEQYGARIAGCDVRVISYRLAGRYFCRVENIDPGATIARGNAETLADAKALAFDQAIASLHDAKR